MTKNSFHSFEFGDFVQSSEFARPLLKASELLVQVCKNVLLAFVFGAGLVATKLVLMTYLRK
jgi:hypothetical protein